MAASILALSFCTATAFAGDAATNPGTISLELNKAEEQPEGCRLYMVVANRLAESYTGYRLDLVVFGADDVIQRRFAVDVAPLRANKTTVKLFDVAGVACRDIGRILLNDILACTVGKDARTGCIDSVTVSSRAAVDLTK